MSNQENPFSDKYASIPSSYEKSGTDPQLSNLQNSLLETKDMMAQNLLAAERRGESLDGLSTTTHNLKLTATTFNTESKKVKKRMWWKHMKLKMCLILTLLLIVAAIVIPIVIYLT